MGRGIAISAARRSLEILLIEKEDVVLQKSMQRIEDALSHEVERWAMTDSEVKGILSQIKGSVDYAEISDQRFIIEALPEKMELKKSVFSEIENHTLDDAIFITNTSTLSITEIATAVKYPDRVIGMHFLNPVQKVSMVEIVKGFNTSADTFHKVVAFAEKLDRTAIEVFESPGYVTTRVMMPLVNEAIQVLMEGVASAEDIDSAIQLGYALPNGPLKMADMIGLDQVLNWLETLYGDLGDPKYKPCPLLRMLVRAGNLGIKSGQGFFRYDAEGLIVPGSGQKAAAYESFFK